MLAFLKSGLLVSEGNPAKSILKYDKSGSSYSMLDYFFLDAKDPTEMDSGS